MVFLWVVIGYLAVLMAVSIRKSFLIKNQEDFMVAGRSVPTYKLVGTLLCTWLGAGSLLAGAGVAANIGIAELWMSAGAWIGIIIIYFMAGRIRRIGAFTVPDILELRYNKWARILGTVIIIIAYTTIVGYQFRAGGYILDLVADVPMQRGIILTAIFVILFTALAGMVSIVTVDVINGAIIAIAFLVVTPIIFINVGGMEHLKASLEPSAFTVLGPKNLLWAMGIFLPTLLLLLGESNMYQKFFSAKSERSARAAVGWWVVGTIILDTTLASMAIIANSHFKLVPEKAETIILHTARYSTEVGVPMWGGMLLLCAAVAIIISTANSYLLTPATNLTRDIYQRFINPDASDKKILFIQRLAVVVLGVGAYLVLTQFETVLAMALTAYTMVGAAITPALLAAILWKRVTPAGGISSMVAGMATTLLITIANKVGDRLGSGPVLSEEYIVLPAALCSVLVLVIVSLSTRPHGYSGQGQARGSVSTNTMGVGVGGGYRQR